MNKKHFVVFSKRLARALVNQGFVLVDKQVNKFRPDYFVYIFEYDEEIETSISKITKNYQNTSAH